MRILISVLVLAAVVYGSCTAFDAYTRHKRFEKNMRELRLSLKAIRIVLDGTRIEGSKIELPQENDLLGISQEYLKRNMSSEDIAQLVSCAWKGRTAEYEKEHPWSGVLGSVAPRITPVSLSLTGPPQPWSIIAEPYEHKILFKAYAENLARPTTKEEIDVSRLEQESASYIPDTSYRYEVKVVEITPHGVKVPTIDDLE